MLIFIALDQGTIPGHRKRMLWWCTANSFYWVVHVRLDFSTLVWCEAFICHKSAHCAWCRQLMRNQWRVSGVSKVPGASGGSA